MDTCDERDLHRTNNDMHHRCCQHSGTAVVLDIQCFKDNNNGFVLKEASVIDVNTGTLFMHHVAQPPYDRDCLSAEKLRESYWLTKHYHGLRWDQGDITYHALIDKLRTCLAKRSIVYVKGSAKKELVKKHLLLNTASDLSTTVVLDMSDMGCASLPTLSSLLSTQAIRCGQHKSAQHRCALANCSLLRSWLLVTGSESHCSNYFCDCCR